MKRIGPRTDPQVNYLLDEFAPYKRISKKAYKLKSKPWISRDIQFLMWERDKIFHKYCKEDNQEREIISTSNTSP